MGVAVGCVDARTDGREHLWRCIAFWRLGAMMMMSMNDYEYNDGFE
jgi:hypothetical protein